MEDQNKQQTQSRFIIAAILSMAVLTGWSYFFAPERKPEDQANANVNATQKTESEKPETETETKPEAPVPVKPKVADATPNKTIKIKSPLYELVLDSKGAKATSWILKINDSPDPNERQQLFADGSNGEKKPLQLISKRGLDSNPSRAPFKIRTADAEINEIVNERNYSISVDDEEIELAAGDSKEIVFTLDGPDGVKAEKKFVFRGDSYVADFAVTLTENGKTVPNTKIFIGPSTGDQGVPVYGFYTVEPEAVYSSNSTAERQYAASIISDDGKSGEVKINGALDWAGVGDSYFAMAVIPAQPVSGLEITSWKYTEETEPFFDGFIATIMRSETKETTKHLITAYVPVAADGSVNYVYTGTKDYFVLENYNRKLTELAGRDIDIEDFVNYGWLYYLTKPLSVPILYALRWLTALTANYGTSLIIFTFFFYSLLFPLRWYSSKSFKKAQKNAPKMQEIRDKMKKLQDKNVPMDDPRMRELQMEQLKMTKDALPIGGCLPMLLQFPLIITLYYTVSIALGFRQETFWWLPDLSQADPYKILPVAFAISMVLTMKFTPTAPTVTPEQQMQQKIMIYFMPVMMLFFMWSAPSGLLLYWFTGNIIMFGQQMIINWINKDPAEDEVESTGGTLKTKKA